MTDPQHQLGSLASSETLIRELYIDLRRRINLWAAITKQTAQARMGYVGQHLVSIATGHPGGRSGARGKDLIISATESAEIKTCYRVDQLGKCLTCGEPVASIETECASCGSADVKRNEDSKWLIGIRNELEYSQILDPKYYFFVLFEFTDVNNPTTIRASIWRVDPLSPGFAYALIDYYGNIRSKSISKAPFNIWPHALKFAMMRPCLIYRSYINSNDTIQTECFPGITEPMEEAHIELGEFARSRVTADNLQQTATSLGLGPLCSGPKRAMISQLIEKVQASSVGAGEFADALAYGYYRSSIDAYLDDLPENLRDRLDSVGLLT